MQDKNHIKVTTYKNAVEHRMLNKRLMVVKEGEDTFEVHTKILLHDLTDKERAAIIKDENSRSILVRREHSKYCVWHNYMKLSRIAFECLFETEQFIDRLKIE